MLKLFFIALEKLSNSFLVNYLMSQFFTNNFINCMYMGFGCNWNNLVLLSMN